MRTGPHPLHMHLSLASALLPEGDSRDYALAKMVQGIQKYQNFSENFVRPMLHTVVEFGATKLSKVDRCKEVHHDRPVLLIPSLINRSTILNLTQDNSFALWLAEQGFPVYLLTWGDICAEQSPPDLDILIGDRMKEALGYIQDQHDAQAHLLGYCMGGTLSMAPAVLWPELVGSLTLLASPWDMHAGENSLSERVQFWAGSVASGLESKGFVPAAWLQGLFASLDPEMTLNKFTRFVDVKPGSSEELMFVAVEDWLNEGRDIPGSIAQICIIDWFIKNRTARKEWRVRDTVIMPESVQCPVMIVASKRDRLVTYESATCALSDFPNAHHVAPDCGHIGMMVGRHAKGQVWQKFADWVLDQKL